MKEGVNGLVLGLSMEGYVLARNQVDLEGVELLSKETVEQWVVLEDGDIQVRELHCPPLVEGPRVV